MEKIIEYINYIYPQSNHKPLFYFHHSLAFLSYILPTILVFFFSLSPNLAFTTLIRNELQLPSTTIKVTSQSPKVQGPRVLPCDADSYPQHGEHFLYALAAAAARQSSGHAAADTTASL